MLSLPTPSLNDIPTTCDLLQHWLVLSTPFHGFRGLYHDAIAPLRSLPYSLSGLHGAIAPLWSLGPPDLSVPVCSLPQAHPGVASLNHTMTTSLSPPPLGPPGVGPELSGKTFYF